MQISQRQVNQSAVYNLCVSESLNLHEQQRSEDDFFFVMLNKSKAGQVLKWQASRNIG